MQTLKLDRESKLVRILGMARVVIGPPALVLLAWSESVRVRGPLTTALAQPQTALVTAISDVLVVGALAAFILWAAAEVVGSKRPILSHFILPVAASHLPLAGIALLSGRRFMGAMLEPGLLDSGQEFMQSPWLIIPSLGHVALGIALLTVVTFLGLHSGYRRASKLKGVRLHLSLVAAIIVAEIVCRFWFAWTG